MSEKDGGSAFPEVYTDFHAKDGQHGRHDTYSAGGMSLRDYFAAKAMNVELSRIRSCDFQGNWAEKIAYASYRLADAMLAEKEIARLNLLNDGHQRLATQYRERAEAAQQPEPMSDERILEIAAGTGLDLTADYPATVEELVVFARALLATQPDGWVSVPTEPTEAMIFAAGEAWENSNGGLAKAWRDVYIGMLAAAPKEAR